MKSALEFGLVTCVASLAIAVTISAWRARRTTPRTVSLVFSVAACMSIVVAAADCGIPLPSAMCMREVAAEPGALETALEDDLGGWGWWVRPCGRLVVTVRPEDLAAPIDFGRLTAMAAAAGVVVDVHVAKGGSPEPRELELAYRTRSQKEGRLPLGTPIAASNTGDLDLRPALRGHDAQLSCRLGFDDAQTGRSLAELLGDRSEAEYQGFHRLQCWLPGRERLDTPTTGYLQVRSAPAVVVSETARQEALFEPDRADSPASLALALVEWTTEREFSEAATHARSDPSMLILDRPQGAAICDHAKSLLDRGGTVVVAMPGDGFVEQCKGWLPVRAELTARGESIHFDRRPRVTFVLDDFAEGLDDMPSCIIEDTKEGAVCRPLSPGTLTQSRTVQIEGAKALCSRLKGDLPGTPDCTLLRPLKAAERTDDYDPVVVIRRAPTLLEGQERIDRSSAPAGLGELARAWRGQRVRWEEELVVLFTHDPATPDPTTDAGALQRPLDSLGARVYAALIVDPYGISLRSVFSETKLSDDVDPTSKLVTDVARRFSTNDRHLSLSHDRELLSIDASLSPPQRLTHAKHRPRAYSRFAPALSERRLEARSPAPTRFTWWKELADEHRVSAAAIAYTTKDSGLTERPLAVGALVGSGHLLLLAYSPFEALREDPEEPWPKRPTTHTEVLGGLALLKSLYTNTSELVAELNGPVLSVRARPDGALWIDVVEPSSPGADLMRRRFLPTGPRARHEDPDEQPRRALDAPLVDFDPVRRIYTYALSASALDVLRGCEMYQSDLGGAPIHVCPPGKSEGPTTRADAALGYRLLARYSGGRVLDEKDAPDGDSVHTRPLGLGALSLLFLLGWGRRARRRLAARRASRRLHVAEQIAQRRFDPPHAVVAAAGDWDGRSSTWPRTGAFGGYRPLEPGDRTSAIVLQDLVLAARGGAHVLPRVSQRIEEAAPSVVILVNLGASMRIPERGEGKAHFAGRVALHLAALAWSIGGEVTIRAMGVTGDPEVIAPTRVSPGHDELVAALDAHLARRPSHPDRPWPDDLPECGSLIYVSDFQLEDDRSLLEWFARVEGEGIRAGGAMVFSPLELSMIEGGRLANSGVWADRADWDPDDVFEALSRRRDAVERIFDSVTTGGLVVADTSFSQEDLEAALMEGRLLHTLR